MNAELRRITPGEYEAARALWDICFPEDAAGYSAYYFARRTRPEYVFAAFEAGEMTAALHALPYPLDFYGAVKPCAMVAGVATLPGRRHRGLAGALIRHAHGALRESGVCAAVLKPDVDFYAQFGYLPFAYHDRYTLSAANAGETAANAGEIPANAGEIPALHTPGAGELLSIYTRDRARYAGRMVRTLSDMENSLAEAETLGGFAACGGNAAEGGAAYALCVPDGDGVDAWELAGYPYGGLLRALALRYGNVTFRLSAGAQPPAGAELIARDMFSMLCPLDEAALLEGTPAKSVEALLCGETGSREEPAGLSDPLLPLNTLEFC